ncbi:hypothetical protein [Spongorhabdus nitratireducens]
MEQMQEEGYDICSWCRWLNMVIEGITQGYFLHCQSFTRYLLVMLYITWGECLGKTPREGIKPLFGSHNLPEMEVPLWKMVEDTTARMCWLNVMFWRPLRKDIDQWLEPRSVNMPEFFYIEPAARALKLIARELWWITCDYQQVKDGTEFIGVHRYNQVPQTEFLDIEREILIDDFVSNVQRIREFPSAFNRIVITSGSPEQVIAEARKVIRVR